MKRLRDDMPGESACSCVGQQCLRSPHPSAVAPDQYATDDVWVWLHRGLSAPKKRSLGRWLPRQCGVERRSAVPERSVRE